MRRFPGVEVWGCAYSSSPFLTTQLKPPETISLLVASFLLELRQEVDSQTNRNQLNSFLMRQRVSHSYTNATSLREKNKFWNSVAEEICEIRTNQGTQQLFQA